MTSTLVYAILLAFIFSTAGAVEKTIYWSASKRYPKMNANVGDTVKFLYEAGAHNVVMPGTKKEYQRCTGGIEVGSYDAGEYIFNASTPGKYYFYCTPHCKGGQRITLDVKKSKKKGKKAKKAIGKKARRSTGA